ncbi:hypothetical protein Catovirus_1_860 [Catovirus CTV1]|uniref:Uncharacterized protein n=1 Tax=Catovirus CTV1 TaxID=1977631 RepID=A0A1V0SAR2_9VIRU|nr:hypothetical protein Catovirus_1_860 [Catovirus CTV1]
MSSKSTDPSNKAEDLNLKTFLNSGKVKVSKENNPIKYVEKCDLFNTKKSKYYIHTYDPTVIKKNIEKNPQYFGDALDVFDFTPRKNCCNCVSISLYWDKVINEQTAHSLRSYMTSIKKTIVNVKQNLNDWIVRVYIDYSVHKFVTNIKETQEESYGTDLRETYNYILNSENTEVYTYICESMSGKQIARTRSLRFFPFVDEEVNICVSREADGIVSNLDCHNLKVFEKDKEKYLYIVDLDIGSRFVMKSDDLYRFASYSIWLNFYKSIFDREYFEKRHNLYDPLAGTIGLKLKVKKCRYNLYAQKIQFYTENENSLRSCILSQIQNKKIADKDAIKLNLYGRSKIYGNSEVFEEKLKMGFDEMLLLLIFKDLLSVNYKLIDVGTKFTYDNKELELKKTYILSSHNMITQPFIITRNKYNEKLLNFCEQLKKNKIIKKCDKLSKKIDIIKQYVDDNDDAGFYPSVLAYIDSLLTTDNIIINKALDIKLYTDYESAKKMTLSGLINSPYTTYQLSSVGRPDLRNYDIENYDQIYNMSGGQYYDKYLKYKQKYLDLKNKKTQNI